MKSYFSFCPRLVDEKTLHTQKVIWNHADISFPTINSLGVIRVLDASTLEPSSDPGFIFVGIAICTSAIDPKFATYIW
jgi:hypothetical protein